MNLLLAAALLLQVNTPEKLVEQLNSDKLEDRGRAREQLKKLGQAAVPALEQAAKGNDVDLAKESRDLLEVILFRGGYAHRMLERLRSEDAKEFESAKRELKTLGPVAEPALIEALADPDRKLKVAFLEVLTELKATGALEPVGGMFLSETDPDVRPAVENFLRSQGPRAESILFQGLNSKALIVRLSAITILGDIGGTKAHERISMIYREDKDWNVRRSCFAFFKRRGHQAENDLILATRDEIIDIRRDATLALGDLGSKEVIPRLIDLLSDPDLQVKEASQIALALLGTAAAEELEKAVQSGRVSKSLVQAIRARHQDVEVERVLQAKIGLGGSTGTFEGKFKELAALGRASTVSVLIRILSDPGYRFDLAYRHGGAVWYPSVLKETAVEALGELGGDGALAAVKAFSAAPEQKYDDRLKDATLVAQFRLGEEKPLQDHLLELRREADGFLRRKEPDYIAAGCQKLASLGLLLSRLKRREEATGVYQELSDTLERETSATERAGPLQATTYYNLACLNALAGNGAKAVGLLEKAVRTGFKDRAWIEADRDLDSIRVEESYKKLVADDALFEKK